MVIDIDSFLDRFEEQKEEVVKEEEVSLEFESDLKNRIKNYETEGIQGDFLLLKKIYDEIKKFDESIPVRFADIEKSGAASLKVLGNKYSRDFYNKLKENVSILQSKINEHMLKLDQVINTDQYHSIIHEFDEILKLYSIFPKEFYKEKSAIYLDIKKREVAINRSIEEYKQSKLTNLKSELKKASYNLSKSLVPGNLYAVEENMEKLHSILLSVPKIFMSDISKEKVVISALLMKSQNYLREEYVREFKDRKNRIDILTLRYRDCIIKNDFEKTLVTYDEIIFQFEKLPDVFLEEKVKVYAQINELYTLINDLLMKNNVSLFFETYNSSRILEEARDYIRHIKTSKIVNRKGLEDLKEKLHKVSDRFSNEKKEILITIEKLIKLAETRKIQNQKSQVLKDDNELDKTSIIKNSNDTDSRFKGSILEDINGKYQKLKNSSDPQEIKLLYKEISSQLNTIALPKKLKDDTIKKVNSIVASKKFN